MATAQAFYNDIQIQDADIKETPTFSVVEKQHTGISIKGVRTILVYNPANMEAVLATAIIKQHYPQVEIHEAGMDLPTTGATYLWLGVAPTTNMFPSTHGLGVWRSAEHFVAASNQPVRQFKVKMLYVGQHAVHNEEVNHEPSENMTGYILHFLGIQDTKYSGLVHLVHRFYDRKMDIDTLAYIYDGVKRAQLSLTTGEFSISPPCIEQVESYMVAVQNAKKALNNSYTVRDLIVDKKRSKVILTCNTKDFWITRRLTSFSYQNYANSVMMLNGPSVQTNLNVTKLFKHEAVTILN